MFSKKHHRNPFFKPNEPRTARMLDLRPRLEAEERLDLNLEAGVVIRLPEDVLQEARAFGATQIELEGHHEEDHHDPRLVLEAFRGFVGARVHQGPLAEGVEEVQELLPLGNAEALGRHEPAHHPGHRGHRR